MYSYAERQALAHDYIDARPPNILTPQDDGTVTFDVIREAPRTRVEIQASWNPDRIMHRWLPLGPEFEFTVILRTRWSICDYCEGEGHHAQHLGVISQETLDDWDEEDFESYRSGRYDMPCEFCRGSGKVRTPDWSTANHPAAQQWYEDLLTEYYATEAMHIAEIRAGA